MGKLWLEYNGWIGGGKLCSRRSARYVRYRSKIRGHAKSWHAYLKDRRKMGKIFNFCSDTCPLFWRLAAIVVGLYNHKSHSTIFECLAVQNQKWKEWNGEKREKLYDEPICVGTWTGKLNFLDENYMYTVDIDDITYLSNMFNSTIPDILAHWWGEH
jgi:hypothetical protein